MSQHYTFISLINCQIYSQKICLCVCVCCLHMFVLIIITAMPANSPSIYMSVVLTADSMCKVLGEQQSLFLNRSLSLPNTHTQSVVQSRRMRECVCETEEEKSEAAVSSPNQYHIQTTVIPMLILCLSILAAEALSYVISHVSFKHHLLILHSAGALLIHSRALPEHQKQTRKTKCSSESVQRADSSPVNYVYEGQTAW